MKTFAGFVCFCLEALFLFGRWSLGGLSFACDYVAGQADRAQVKLGTRPHCQHTGLLRKPKDALGSVVEVGGERAELEVRGFKDKDGKIRELLDATLVTVVKKCRKIHEAAVKAAGHNVTDRTAVFEELSVDGDARLVIGTEKGRVKTPAKKEAPVEPTEETTTPAATGETASANL